MTLFQLLNAPTHPAATTVWLALFCAERLVLAVPLVLAFLWLRGDIARKNAVFAATAAGLLALGVAQLFALHYVPRPFAAGIGHTLLPHVADSSFPSDHSTLMAAVAVILLFTRETRRLGLLLVALWLPMAWGRVYVGVHYPSDLVGGAVLGATMALLVWGFGEPLVRAGTTRLTTLYALLFGPLIARGWLT